MKKWRCKLCGYTVEADEPPTVCPLCGAPATSFELVEE
ncbi:MAG: rubredoxin [Coriobacteriaceae bacterium]|nr:rubredoxin [Coriobacteriaceae bacterium]